MMGDTALHQQWRDKRSLQAFGWLPVPSGSQCRLFVFLSALCLGIGHFQTMLSQAGSTHLVYFTTGVQSGVYASC